MRLYVILWDVFKLPYCRLNKHSNYQRGKLPGRKGKDVNPESRLCERGNLSPWIEKKSNHIVLLTVLFCSRKLF